MKTLIFTLLFFASLESSFACKCSMPSTKTRFDGADVVFRGVVSAILPGTPGKVVMKVKRQWKGEQPDTGVIEITNTNTMCAVEFKKDKEYVLFLKPSDGALRATMCDTIAADKAKTDIKWLDKNRPPQPARRINPRSAQ